MVKRALNVGGIGVGCLLAACAAGARAADPVADIQAQYQSVLSVLRKPPISGVLVTEVAPESAAAAGEMRGGDIITEYYGAKINTVDGLAQQVADAVAQRVKNPELASRVLVRVRRGTEEKFLQIPRDALGIRAVQIKINELGPHNPPPSLRGTLALDWKAAATPLRDDPEPAFRTFERTGATPDAAASEIWIGWQLCKLAATADALGGTIDLSRIDTVGDRDKEGEAPNAEHTTITFHLNLGDYKTSPAFVLDEAAARFHADASTLINASAKRLGERFQTAISIGGGPELPAHENGGPLDAIPQAALPWVAAAMPQEPDAALGISLMALRDFLPRPGYVLATRGRQLLPDDPAETAQTRPAATVPASRAWRVDLLHVGVIIESYWFSDQRRLLCVVTQGAHPIVSRRVPGVKEASLPMERKPATPPTTLPAPLP